MNLFFLILPIVAGFFGFYKYFHRIPKRDTPTVPNAIIAPADGVIWQVIALNGKTELVVRKKIFGQIKTLSDDVPDAAVLVSIFMNPLDCHANWSPVEGKVIYSRHTPGKFSLANTWESLWNEKNEILMQADGYRLKIIQIAGFVARRIDCWIREKENLARGQLIGMIRLGSQVTLILPSRVLVQVKKGQKVKGGETILGIFEK